MNIKLLGLAVLALLLSALPAVSHHSFAMFDQSKVVYMTGKVKQFEWVNPHAWLHLTITTSDGKEATWSFEGGSVAQLASLGWKPESGQFPRRRRGQNRLSPDEGWLPGRSAHECHARSRTKAVL